MNVSQILNWIHLSWRIRTVGPRLVWLRGLYFACERPESLYPVTCILHFVSCNLYLPILDVAAR